MGDTPKQPDRHKSNGRSTVHRLYQVADPSVVHVQDNQDIEHEQRQLSASNPIPMSSIENLLKMNSRSEEDTPFHQPSYGRSFSYHGTSTWVRVGGYIQGNCFTLQVRKQPNAHTNGRVREVVSTSCMEGSDSSLFQEIQHSDVNPMFEVEFERSMEMTGDSHGLNMKLNFNTDLNENVNYLILEQEAGSTQWRDITGTCTTTPGSPKIEIPVKKNSRIWVIRLKKSFSSMKHALLALIHGQILFHILVYYMKKNAKVKVRIIGISEEVYQNPKGLKTPVTTAEADKFQKSPEAPPKLLLKKDHLNLEVRKNGKCLPGSSKRFDIRSSKSSDWHDCDFSPNELKENLEIKVMDTSGTVKWSIDLKEILCDEWVHVEQPADISKPEIPSFNDEVCEHHIPWLARHLNKDVEKVARILKVDSDEIEAIKQGELPETRNIRILELWRKTTLQSGNKPRWSQVKSVLESENVGRFDITRCLQNQNEIDIGVFLWLEQRVASFCDRYVRVLGVPDHEVDTILAGNYQSCEERCTALLKKWRQRTPNPKVEDLIEALEHDTMKKNELAKEMRSKFANEG